MQKKRQRQEILLRVVFAKVSYERVAVRASPQLEGEVLGVTWPNASEVVSRVFVILEPNSLGFELGDFSTPNVQLPCDQRENQGDSQGVILKDARDIC